MRPIFKDIKNYDEFIKYYWYFEELKVICKNLGIDYSGSKKDLNNNIKEYFNGNIIKKKKIVKNKVITNELNLDTKLIECGFCFNQRFRDFFIKETCNPNFKFNADMVASSKKVKETKDSNFTLGNMLDIYYGKLEYAKYDKVSCEWNQFLKDFCNDPRTIIYKNKIKVASILWAIVRNSTDEKKYTSELLDKYGDKCE